MKQPYIARDTKEPLVVMGGYRVASNGGLIRETIKHTPNPTATEADLAMLTEHGIAGLEAKGLYGVLDRLRTSGAGNRYLEDILFSVLPSLPIAAAIVFHAIHRRK